VLLRLAEKALEVLAVEPAADEALRPDRIVMRPRPADEVVRVVRQGAHRAGGNVEAVGLEGRPVRHAAPDRPEPVDENDARGPSPAQELRGDGRAAEAAADHDEGGGAAHARGEDSKRPANSA